MKHVCMPTGFALGSSPSRRKGKGYARSLKKFPFSALGLFDQGRNSSRNKLFLFLALCVCSPPAQPRGRRYGRRALRFFNTFILIYLKDSIMANIDITDYVINKRDDILSVQNNLGENYIHSDEYII